MMIFGRRFGVILAGLVLVASAGVASAQSPNARQAAINKAVQKAENLTQEQLQQSNNIRGLRKLKQLYAGIGDKQRYRWTLKRLTTLIPGELDLKLELAASYASDDLKSKAYDVLLRLRGQGFGVDISDAPAFEKIHGTEVWDYIVTNLKFNLKPFGEGKKAFDLPGKDMLYNALGWDPVHEQFLVGSARDGGIYHANKQGNLSPFIESNDSNKLWSIMDMAVGPEGENLWVATTSVTYFKGYDSDNAGKAALLEFDLDSGELLHRYVLDGRGKFLSSVFVAPDGQVYAADGVHSVVYALKDGKLETWLQNPRLNGIRTLTVSSDGNNLYLADPVLGIIGVELATGEPFVLRYNPETLVLPGIVDMHSYKNALVIIEPGMQPQRVMRLKLSDDGTRVTDAMPLEVANPLFKSLGDGTTVGDKLYYMTASQRGNYDAYGLLEDDANLEPVPVFVSDMDFAWDKKGVRMNLSPIGSANSKEAKGGAGDKE